MARTIARASGRHRASSSQKAAWVRSRLALAVDRDYGVSSSGPSRVAACLPGRRTLPLLEATDEDWYQV